MITKRTTTTIDSWLNRIGIETEKPASKYGVIYNRDKTIRWIWPAHAQTPVFLKLYTVSGFKSQLFFVMCHLVFKFRLQRLFFKHTEGISFNFKLNIDLDCWGDWAIFTGTPGPNRKIIITGSTFNEKSVYFKIPLGKRSQTNISREYEVLRNLKSYKFNALNYPSPIFTGSRNILQLSDVSEGQRSKNLGQAHIDALLDIDAQTGNKQTLASSTFWNEVKDLQTSASQIKDNRIPRGIKRKLDAFIKTISLSKTTHFCLAHGDFTPWNSLVNKDKITLYDWELAIDCAPIGFDAIHFVMQTGILQKRASWDIIESTLHKQVLGPIFRNDVETFRHHLKLYMAYIIPYYLNTFANQPNWHTQVTWLLQTWTNGLSKFLKDQRPERELILIDVFDFLHDKQYATLKFKHSLPEDLSEYSDVDMCIQKSDTTKLFNYLAKHPLVGSVRKRTLSFMSTIEIIATNGQFLTLDCISKIKRKNIVFGDAKDIIERNTPNNYGIKQAALQLESQYINAFYILNNAKVPIEYRSNLFEYDLMTSSAYSNNESLKDPLMSQLSLKSENRGIKKVINTFQYISDTVKSAVQNQGYLVTFTGVDGAGKTTLINITKKRIEKELRKPVIVLRHRPSILPIISRLVLGKKTALQVSENHSPHSGNNSNIVSSLIRFSYYLIDYTIGQWVVFFKYSLRGKVVIYDRYYYDFICDPKRSNIVIPHWVAKLGMLLIKKPRINFFIYADARLIRQRKQELSIPEISQLTTSYLSLFKSLSAKSKNSVFEPIENIDIDFTTNRIMKSISLHTS